MPEKRSYAKTRQMVSYNEYMSKRGSFGLYCIDRAVYGLLRKLVAERGLWRSTYYIDNFDNYYTIPDVAEFEQIDRDIAEFLGGGDMSCDLLSGLRGIEAAIRSKQCCGGGGASGSDGGVRYGSGRQLYSPTSEQGAIDAGFSGGLSEYSTHKCDAANAIIDGLVASINNLAGISLFNLVAGGTVLFAVGLLSNPPLAIMVIVAGLGLATGAFYGLAHGIDDNRQSLVCALYGSDSTIDAYDNLKAELSEITVDVGGFELGLPVIASMLASMVNTDTLGALYEKVGLPSVGNKLPCNCGRSWVTYGNPKDVDYGAYVVTSEFVSAENQYVIRFEGGCNIEWSGPQVTLSLFYEIISNEGYYVSHNPPSIGSVFTNVQYFNIPRTQSEGSLSVNIEFVG